MHASTCHSTSEDCLAYPANKIKRRKSFAFAVPVLHLARPVLANRPEIRFLLHIYPMAQQMATMMSQPRLSQGSLIPGKLSICRLLQSSYAQVVYYVLRLLEEGCLYRVEIGNINL